ncbi:MULTISPECIES: GNAT family N-acetyltransferase [Hyphomonadaceae]|uniref:GNAT family N-acetyltransferase n=1 Tax=Hyphomonadaceae TaxID=69657 RepID=UPI000A0483A0|nr:MULTISPECIES: GNAT family N-acetyltransferase [Hyphomonadaceae]MAI92021.1 N-acetyltransferase [Ponticaulis sp.]MAK60921.1 N-acetyltransferase [Ponticaulis sp.]OUX96347.1 MAG: hypothetical protein CBB65_16445 [Hyphomonadaceae bacterium TMED5]|tara:strand:+ start:16092 stop:16694 length:603 start_codon:yes stop_codon:yes gene_type:complete
MIVQGPYIGSDRKHRIVLDNGDPVLLRPATIFDRHLFARGIEELSGRSRYLRFHFGFEKVPLRLLDRLTAIDGCNHLSWGAIHEGKACLPAVAAIHALRRHDEPASGDLAFGVTDNFQRRGIASLLLTVMLQDCLAAGIRTLHAHILYENIPALRLVKSFAAELIGSFEFGEIYALSIPKALAAILAKDKPKAATSLIWP